MALTPEDSTQARTLLDTSIHFPFGQWLPVLHSQFYRLSVGDLSALEFLPNTLPW